MLTTRVPERDIIQYSYYRDQIVEPLKMLNEHLITNFKLKGFGAITVKNLIKVETHGKEADRALLPPFALIAELPSMAQLMAKEDRGEAIKAVISARDALQSASAAILHGSDTLINTVPKDDGSSDVVKLLSEWRLVNAQTTDIVSQSIQLLQQLQQKLEVPRQPVPVISREWWQGFKLFKPKFPSDDNNHGAEARTTWKI